VTVDGIEQVENAIAMVDDRRDHKVEADLR